MPLRLGITLDSQIFSLENYCTLLIQEVHDLQNSPQLNGGKGYQSVQSLEYRSYNIKLGFWSFAQKKKFPFLIKKGQEPINTNDKNSINSIICKAEA